MMDVASDPRVHTAVLMTSSQVGKSEILNNIAAGDRSDAHILVRMVYDDLQRLAHTQMRGLAPGHTLQPTALVHEVFLKLVNADVEWRSRSHFFAIGARAMRLILVDHARAKKREKRGGGWERVSLAQVASPAGSELDADQLLALHRAVEKLAELDARQARVVEMRFFGGLSVAETAEVLGISSRTVEGDWTHARVWLRREMDGP